MTHALLDALVALAGILAGLALVVLALRHRRRYLLRIPACAATLTLVLGTLLAAWTYPGDPPLTSVYRTLQLFAGEASWMEALFERAEGHVALTTSAHAVRILAILATFSLIASLFRNVHSMLLLAIARRRDHIVLCGLGELGMQFVDGYDRESVRSRPWYQRGGPRSRLLIIEQDPANPNVETCLDRGFAVLTRDVLDEHVLARLARVHRARAVVHVLPDDARNIELAIAVRGVFAARQDDGDQRRGRPTKLLVHVDDARLARRAQDHNRLGPEFSTETRFFNVYEDSARVVFRDHPPDGYADVADADRVHVALYGYNLMAEALLLQAVRLCHFDNQAPLRVSVFDPARADCEAEFRRRYDGMLQIPGLEIRFLGLPTSAPAVTAEALGKAAGDGTEACTPPTQHFVCFEADPHAARFALALREQLRDLTPARSRTGTRGWNAPVFVRINRRRGLARMFDDAHLMYGGHSDRLESPDALHAFGMLDDVMGPAELLADRRDQLARILHEQGYRREWHRQGKPPTNVWRNQSNVDWENLNLFLKQSNRAQADHIPVKLRALRCTDAKPSARVPSAAPSPAGADEVEQSWLAWIRRQGHPISTGVSAPIRRELPEERLAMLEHARWNAFHYSANWRHGPRRVDPARVHNNLVAWDDLDDGTKSFDRATIRDIARFVADCGREPEADEPIAGGRGIRLRRRTTPPPSSHRRVCREVLVGVTAGATAPDPRDGAAPGRSPSEPQLAELAERVWREAQTLANGLPVRFRLLSALTDGPERLLTRRLLGLLDADLTALLPLPFELFYMDFSARPDRPREVRNAVEAPSAVADQAANGADKQAMATALWNSVHEYASLIARASTCFELPMRFGNLEALHRPEPEDAAASPETSPHLLQYQLADAYLVQRCDLLVAVDRALSASDPLPTTPGHLDAVRNWWRLPDTIPPGLLWHTAYHGLPAADRPALLEAAGGEAR